ncbi:MAG: HDIG domain-containing metalloprotein [Acidimicrobiia bacterium]
MATEKRSATQHHIEHLVRRFFGAVCARSLRPSELEWVGEILDPPIMVLWCDQRRWDQRHAYRVARRVSETQRERVVIAAALTHDIGKSASGLGPIGRSFATVLGAVAGRSRRSRWRRGFFRKVRDYFDHPDIGAAMLESCGAPREVVEWARIHQKQMPRPVLLNDSAVRALIDADDD